jgi:molybdopterin-guanine dinucleotide biosynthesis protein A
VITRVSVSAIVLAGGRSSRFGADKLAADLGGRSVLERTIEAVGSVAGEVLVIGRRGRVPGVTYVADDRPFEGPLAGLAAGLRRASGTLVIAVAGDMPSIEPAVLRLLVGRLDAAAAAVLDEAGVRRPLPIAAKREAALVAAEAALAGGERSLRSLLDRLETASVPEGEWRSVDPSADSLADIDTPADLERLRTRD